tara:strand:- start:224 stop:400 length:177 start_codon:yes stop_codon:yes gene_type:complete
MQSIDVKHYYHIMVTSDNKFIMLKQNGGVAGDVKPVNDKDYLTLSEVFDTLYDHIDKP